MTSLRIRTLSLRKEANADFRLALRAHESHDPLRAFHCISAIQKALCVSFFLGTVNNL